MSEHTDDIGALELPLEKERPVVLRIKCEFTVDVTNPEVSWWVRRLQGPPFQMSGMAGGRGGPDNDIQVGLQRFFDAIRRQVEEAVEPF